MVSIREKERELLLCFFIYIFSHKCKWRTCALEVVSGFFYSNIFVLLLLSYFLHKLYCGGGRTCAVEVVTVDLFLLFNSYVFLLLLLFLFKYESSELACSEWSLDAVMCVLQPYPMGNDITG